VRHCEHLPVDSEQSPALTRYEPPRLRELGAVAALTQGGMASARSDGILFDATGGGRTVKTS